MLRLILFSCVFQVVFLSDPGCVIDLECAECVPESMPLVTSHRARNGSVRVAHGDELQLSCAPGRLLAFPLRSTLTARCERGRYRVPAAPAAYHLLDLGCQEDIFEDVLHEVEHCAPPLQGRAYQMQESKGGTRHLATVCYDEDRGVATVAHASSAPGGLRLPPHDERRSPLTLLGNFNHMFDARTRADADKLYSDEARLNRRLREMFKHDGFTFAEQRLVGAKLLGAHYFDDQEMRVSEFVSNKVGAWASVARGNLAHVHRDVGALVGRARRAGPALHVYAGTHGAGALRGGGARAEVRLRAGRFPVPRYVWTVVAGGGRALALVVLNDPFVAVSEIRAAVFCESACSRARWLSALLANRNYEVPLYGLTFCCSVHNFTQLVPEMPKKLLKHIPPGDEGMLFDL